MALGAILGLDPHTVNDTVQNALSNNFIISGTLLAISIGSALWTAYDVYEAYKKGGAEAALKQLGFDLALMAVGGGIAKGIGKGIGKGTKLLLNTKTGQVAFASADEMLRHIINDSPLLKIAFNNTNLVQKVTTKTVQNTNHTTIKLVTKKVGESGKVTRTAKPHKEDPKYTIRPNQKWKEKIHGRAQVTGTKKNPDRGHAFLSKKEAIRAAKRDDVTYVQMDLGVNRMLPKKHRLGPKGNVRPDVASKTKDGKIHTVEIPSRTDKVPKLRQKLETTQKQFPENMQGGLTNVIERKFD